MNLRYNIIASTNLESLLSEFMNQNNISALDMRNYLNNFMVRLNEAIQTQLLLEIQENEKQKTEKENQEKTVESSTEVQ